MDKPAFVLTLKDGSAWILGADGGVLFDGTRGMLFSLPHETWRVVGIATRHNARALVSLSDAASGAPLGQGWVHDFDHGARSLWAMPKNRRAVSVRRFTPDDADWLRRIEHNANR